MKFEEAVLKAQKVCEKERYVYIERTSNKASVCYFYDTRRVWCPIEEGLEVLDLIADDWEVVK